MKVNPTRQELLKLKKRLKIAKSGHKLLKEKLDGLMREFLKEINNLTFLRKEIENELPSGLIDFFYSSNVLGIEKVKGILSNIPKAKIEETMSNVMGVEVKDYKTINKEEIEKASINYESSNYNLLLSKKKITSLNKKILDYISLHLRIKEMASEIEKNRRRVNSLEHVYIPQVEKAGKYIAQKLEEGERFNRTVILKIKTMLDREEVISNN